MVVSQSNSKTKKAFRYKDRLQIYLHLSSSMDTIGEQIKDLSDLKFVF